jgi:hypothetical protein
VVLKGAKRCAGGQKLKQQSARCAKAVAMPAFKIRQSALQLYARQQGKAALPSVVQAPVLACLQYLPLSV